MKSKDLLPQSRSRPWPAVGLLPMCQPSPQTIKRRRTKIYGYVTTVASVLLPTPKANASPTLNLPARPASAPAFKRSNTPYVIAGFTVNTKPGLRPVHSAVGPPSATISPAVSKKVGGREAVAAILALVCGSHNCWRVAMTATGMVKIWASAPAAAPRASSTEVGSERRWRRRRAVVRSRVWKKKYANSATQHAPRGPGVEQSSE